MLERWKFVRRLKPVVCGQAAMGIVLGLLSWSWYSQFVMAWGAGIDAIAALAIAVLIAAGTMFRPGRSMASPVSHWIWLALAGWTAVTPTLFQLTTLPRSSVVDDRVLAFFTVLSSALAIVTPASLLLLKAVPAEVFTSPTGWRLVASAGAAWCLAPLTVGAWPGPHATALAAAAYLLARFMGHETQSRRQESISTDTIAKSPLVVPPATPGLVKETAPALSTVLLPALAAGVAIVMLGWLRTMLFLPTPALACASIGGLLVGIAWSLRTSSTASHSWRAARLCAILGLELAALAAGFPKLLDLAMSVSASVSWLPAIVGLRSALTAAAFAPAGMALGMAFVVRRNGETVTCSIHTVLGISTFLAAALIAWTSDITLINGFGYTAGTFAMSLALWGSASRMGLPAWRRAVVPCTAAAALLAAWVADPLASLSGQRVLFSGLHFRARAIGIPPELLPAIDDGRLVRSVVTSAGVTDVWAHTGVQWTLRENGLTRGTISRQPAIVPQPVNDVVSAAFPLTVHPQPLRILVTSASYPAVITTCLSFPVNSVTAIDNNPAAIAFCRDAALEVVPSLSQGDTRLTLQQADPVRGLATTGEQFDVVIAPNSIVGDLASSREWTVEHFRHIAAHLSPEGMLCQRIAAYDLNVPTVVDVVHTIQSVFPTVQLSEVAPGEWLVLATLGDRFPLDKEYLERLERPHVRELLSQAGWDWSIMLSLKTIHPETLAAISENGRTLSAGNGRVAYALPLDVMAWGPKFATRQRWIASHAKPLGDALGDEPALVDVQQRLSDVTLGQQVVIDHPDQFWAYRHHVKKRLQDRPRPKVIQTAAEGLKNGLHPEDTRRKQYLSALGKAANSKSREDLDQLGAFFSPFDPLVSPFVSREFVYLDRQSPTPDVASQWRCGYRSIFFSPPTDRSVTNVCDALELLHAHPEVVGSEENQWDCRNALLEVLKNRWGLRMSASATLRYDVPDADRTVALVTEALDDLDSLRTAAGVSEEDWAARRTILEKHLVRPVRAWRTEQSARFALQAATERPPAVE